MNKDNKILYLGLLGNDESIKYTEGVKMLSTLAKNVTEGTKIAIPNPNNLGEKIIYERTNFQSEDPTLDVWDGKSVDTSWYNEIEKCFILTTGAQLAGLRKLVSAGNNFQGKIVRLGNNIHLGYNEWEPIGTGYKEERHGRGVTEHYAIDMDSEHNFCGTLDGLGCAIYGLQIKRSDSENTFQGFFSAIKGATIMNLILESVELGGENADGSYAALFGYAEKCAIINVNVSGNIKGEKCSGIGGVALDTSFYRCVNRATLRANSRGTKRILVGGLVQQIGLSDNIINLIDGREPNLFVNCMSDGIIQIDAVDAAYLWAGQMYGSLAHEKDNHSHAIIIERCISTERAVITVSNLDKKETNAVFYGVTTGHTSPKNFVGSVTDKSDLMEGLVGKTGTEISVTIIKLTDSIMAGSIVIPGSVNTLCSDEGSNGFLTVSTNPLQYRDGIVNLEPYFTFLDITPN